MKQLAFLLLLAAPAFAQQKINLAEQSTGAPPGTASLSSASTQAFTGSVTAPNLAYPQFTYYIDAVNGSDSNAGTTPATAWQSLTKAATALLPGQSIGFHCGQTWYGNLLLPSSGTNLQHVRYGKYGTCANPVIDAATQVTGWTLVSGSTYSAPLSYSAQGGFGQVLEDGVRLTQESAQANVVAGSYYSSGTTVYVWTFDGTSPANHRIEAGSGSKPSPYGVNFNGQAFVDWDSIDETRAGQNGFDFQLVTGAHDDAISNSRASWNALRGFSLSSTALVANNAYNVRMDYDGGFHNLGEPFWIGFGSNNGCNHCEATDGNVLIGSAAVGAYFVNGYIHDITQAAGACVWIEYENTTGAVQPTGTLIDNNVIVNNDSALTGCIVEEGSGTQFTHNLVVTTQNANILQFDSQGGVAGPSTGALYENNTLVQLGGYGTVINFSAATNPTLKNNLVYQYVLGGSEGDVLDWDAAATGVVSDYNDMPDGEYYCGSKTTYYQTLAAWVTGCTEDAHSINSAPVFLDPTRLNFQLHAGAGAIDKGVVLPGVTDKFVGSAPDMGAYEYGGGGPAATLTEMLSVPATPASAVPHMTFWGDSSASYAGGTTNTGGSYTPSAAITLTGIDVHIGTSFAGCTSSPVYEVYDQTAAAATTCTVALTNATSNVHAACRASVPAGHLLTFGIVVGTACTAGQYLNSTAEYIMQ